MLVLLDERLLLVVFDFEPAICIIELTACLAIINETMPLRPPSPVAAGLSPILDITLSIFRAVFVSPIMSTHQGKT